MPELLLLFLGVVVLLGVGEGVRRGALGRRMEHSMDALHKTPTAVGSRPGMIATHGRVGIRPVAVSPEDARRAS